MEHTELPVETDIETNRLYTDSGETHCLDCQSQELTNQLLLSACAFTYREIKSQSCTLVTLSTCIIPCNALQAMLSALRQPANQHTRDLISS